MSFEGAVERPFEGAVEDAPSFGERRSVFSKTTSESTWKKPEPEEESDDGGKKSRRVCWIIVIASAVV